MLFLLEMDIKEKINLISRFAEEIITLEDLEFLLKSGESLNHYIGFEISGKIHLGTGLVCMQKIKDFADAGVKVHILLADYHTWINDKLGGNLEIIKKTAVGYFKEGLSIAYQCLGGNPKDLNFILASDFYHNNDKFWLTLIEVGKNTTLARMKRSITIMGRKEGEEIDFAKLLYPAMQVADIFSGGFHFSQAGIDQRKANVIARDAAKQLKISPLKIGKEIIKPVAVHHHLLLGLDKPAASAEDEEKQTSMKMSKSKPDSAVFIHDSEDEIKRKIKKAYCPEGEIEFNPIIDWAGYLIFPCENKIIVPRKPEHGGNLTFNNIDELKKMFKNKELHPEDLKNFVAEYLIELLKPVREHFEKGEPKKMLGELEELIKRG
ncbi:MAG: Tyrosine-tRNA ligase [Candidatus Wolfebacteria bacterium GW2011_GWA2_42_10]|uniref:tyrosine--tRNA ligase n=2 Tax=Candidatus Wolfeibacteriota TaxID=1752735 RepID=A0A0G1AJS0_9BACT|nr:MAG: Tyrosine-tRNA ligase [Candidatus Wolfebacteria bacterium GW2011_GWB1_41_12]KKS25533.1 MAG: Tyrosine-tRNA ligase [Candidatus Wolfebacteria bacterium GW2011_GWA2_42_10]KKT56581.1 MAG: Tyrosine-tRNA ligase [Candidatus Wolfebacteria bacterium GW2011_GWA1_44_24]